MSDHAGLEFRPAASFGAEALAALFTRSYSGYFSEVRIDAAAFAAMVELQDIALAHSRVALVEGREAGIVLLARRERRGWIGGMGVAPEARGRGLGRALMVAAIEEAKRIGLSAVQLEVIEQNHWAARIYEVLDFRDTRRLDVFIRPAGPLSPAPDEGAGETIPLEEWLAARDRAGAAELPWQRGVPALRRQAADARVAVRRGAGGGIAAALLVRFDAARCVVLDAALAPGAPPAALESLVRGALASRPDAACSLVNLPAGDPAGGAFAALGFERRFVQREMALGL